MPTVQETQKDVMAKVNSVMAALNLYPDIDTTNTQLSFSPSINPIHLLVDFFKTTKGYDWLVGVVSNFITDEVKVMEYAVKGVLLANIRVMLSCSVNPLITENMIKQGVVFNLNQVDLLNMFLFSPIDKSQKNLGRYFYFGCEPEDGIVTIDDVKHSRDFNAVLWYCKNTPGERVVWRREKDVEKPYELKQKGNTWLKQVKSNGIATVEFNGRSSGLSNAEGNSGVYIQEPINNCVHIYIGCCAPVMTDNHSNQIKYCTQSIVRYNDIKKNLENILEKLDKALDENLKIIRKNKGGSVAKHEVENEYKKECDTANKIMKAVDGINIATGQTGLPMNQILDSPSFEFTLCNESIYIPTDLYATNSINIQMQKIDYMNQDSAIQKNYPSAKSNYYYKHPLFEWNADYIASMKLFDEKVVAAQLIDCLTDCIKVSVGINITPQMQFVKQQMREIVDKVINSDEGVITDCFFSFTNDSYNNLLNEVELNRINLRTTNPQTVNNIPPADEVLASLNDISHDASKEEIKSGVSNTLMTAITKQQMHQPEGDADISFKFESDFSIIDNLLNQLVYTIVLSILQPKIYVLLMINTKFLDGEPNFDLPKFTQQFGDLISQLIKTIRDYIFNYFTKELVKVLEEILKTLAVRLSLEQYQTYIRLITHCIECFKIHKNGLDWMPDDVDYADITESTQEENQEC